MQEKKILIIAKIVGTMLCGVIFMALMAFKKLPIPMTSIQMSLQSLSISSLIIILGKRAFWVVLVYLTLATLGLPILPEGTSNPTWFISPAAGYYFGFLFSSFLLLKIISKRPKNFFHAWLYFSLNETLILSCGFLTLCFYLGPQNAWLFGVWPYLFGATLKITAATCLYTFTLNSSLKRDDGNRRIKQNKGIETNYS
ncbi:biotin transporter BioY [Legionella cardiaca]|uniref:Biotin transporter BioY n=1 Tax=Legionella cardiaca TaxID=1071983 RepID=A0ABY8ATW7_9GAMM|nr:biotin transporter BioY [Legionella cardiaca]WED43209.1 biotin transporter BioY [Legionella cardiaca]